MPTTIGDETSNNSSLSEKLHRIELLLADFARGDRVALSAFLQEVEVHASINDTDITCHCHSVALDGNGRPRVQDLIRFIAEHVLDYAIPRSEVDAAYARREKDGSSGAIVRLATRARQLFTDIDNSGESGELLLFVLAERFLKLPQLLCKMDLKTNSRMHFHGADGLHVGVDAGADKLLLYWGESKFHADAASAIRECLSSISAMLLGQTAGTNERDLQLLERHFDFHGSSLEAAIKSFLDPDSTNFNSVEYRGICLVGFDCDNYPDGIGEMELQELLRQLRQRLPAWKKQIAKRAKEENVDRFGIHFFCMPFPSVEEFRRYFRSELGLHESSELGNMTDAGVVNGD